MNKLNQSTHEKSDELLAREYFSRIASGNVVGTLNLFSDSAVVHEPFSKSKNLSGKSEIEPFLNSVIMANKGLDYVLKIRKEDKGGNSAVIADVTFSKQNTIRCTIRFELENTKADKSVRTIKLMNIEFTG